MKRILFISLLFFIGGAGYAQTFEWAKAMSGTSTDRGFSIAVGASGNVYTTGRFAGTVDFDPGLPTYYLTSAGGWNVFVSKLDASGNFLWAKSMGGTSCEGLSIAVDGSGNVYLTGWFVGTVDFDPGAAIYNLTAVGIDDIFVCKLDASGNFLWAKKMGGTTNDRGNSIAVDSSGNIYTTGRFSGIADFDPGAAIYNLTSASGQNIFVSKLNASGNFLWAKNMSGTSWAEGYSIAADDSGNVYTMGYFNDTADFDPGAATYNLASAGSYDIFVSKLDTSGDFLWAKNMGGTGGDVGFSLALDDSGNVYTTGRFWGTADFDPGTGVYNLTTAGGWDIFVSRLDASGNFLWAKNMGGTNFAVGLSIATDGSENVYTTGVFNDTADFDPGAGVFDLTSAGNWDIFISKLDATGNFAWAKNMGGTGEDVGYSVAIDAPGNVYTTGWFGGTVDFDPGAGVYNLTSAGFDDIFVHKMSQVTGIHQSSIINQQFIIYPNPTTGKFSVQGATGEIQVYDLFGRLLLRSKKAQIDMSGYPAGMYVWTASTQRGKLVLE